MFKKFKPYLCWGSVAQQKAIDKEKRQDHDNGYVGVEVENITVDETYLPTIKVC